MFFSFFPHVSANTIFQEFWLKFVLTDFIPAKTNCTGLKTTSVWTWSKKTTNSFSGRPSSVSLNKTHSVTLNFSLNDLVFRLKFNSSRWWTAFYSHCCCYPSSSSSSTVHLPSVFYSIFFSWFLPPSPLTSDLSPLTPLPPSLQVL